MPGTPGVCRVDEMRTQRVVFRLERIFPAEINISGQGTLVSDIGFGKMDISHGSKLHHDDKYDQIDQDQANDRLDAHGLLYFRLAHDITLGAGLLIKSNGRNPMMQPACSS